MPRPAVMPVFFLLAGLLALDWCLTLIAAFVPATSWLPPTLAIGWTVFAVCAVWFACRRLLPLLRRQKKNQEALLRLAAGDLRGCVDPEADCPAVTRLRTFCINDRNAVNTIAAYSREFEHHSDQACAMAQEAKAEASGIDDESHRLSGEMEAVNAAAGEVAGHIGSIAAAVTQMRQASDDIAGNMERARDAVDRASRTARENATRIESLGTQASSGVDGLRQVTTSIESVRDRAVALKHDMDALGRDSKSIGAILGVIADIADQTNLLALNAAIEAARAGESGRGFAVVADEVRKLAEKTMAATKDVETAIHSIQTMAGNNLAATESAVAAVEDSMRLAEEQIGETDALMESMMAVSREVGGITEIVDALKDMVFASSSAAAQHSQATAAIARNLAATSEKATDMRDRARSGHIAVQGISESAATVAQSVADMAAGVLQVNSAARELTRLTGHLAREIEGFRLGDAPFDIAAIKTAHLAWRARLEAVLLGHARLEASEVADHHQCQFGRWYDDEGQSKFGDAATFQEIGQHHERVHALAKTIAGLAGQGKNEEAAARMDAFEDARVKLFDALNRLYLEMTR
ncbi:methyl-accepting chemotaxis sensory transducer [Solidesulfovibrio fructosivorans JJ]]|uniref:Methyl-accepting chemotaxis sensory transducer n=1 Tax=Solidesulfovibrio fructosivorans JJ] TaxID=596151 RepID=E1JW60_SOLFR|nr:methyl-accepting chemotaxis protein [Solidesulfovibrio fructosivorans]EFL51420.1 methyl-accepting chemotaxis sensory transducer [Solidesulfovibrio fructosivorans JJ]]